MPPQVSSVEYHASDDGSHRSRPVGLFATCIILAIAALILAAMVFSRNSAVTSTRAQLNQANAELDHTKADLAAATSKSSGLQAQLDRANGQQADLQKQLTADDGAKTQLQAQLRKTQADFTSLQAQGRSQQQELQSTQSQLAQAQSSSADLQKQVDQSKSQVADLRTQLAQAQAQGPKADAAAATPPTRPLPVTTSLHKGFFSGAYTLEVKNTGSDPLSVNFAITGSPKSPSHAATVPGNGMVKVDHLAAGARVEITSEGATPVDVIAR